MGGRCARRDRGSAHLGGNPEAIHHAASGVLLPAAQVQVRDHGLCARSLRDQDPRYRTAAAQERAERDRLRGAGRRRSRPHAFHRQDHQAVRAWPRSPELCRSDHARLQSVRPPRQHLQGAHQDPGARARRREIRRRGRGRVAADARRRAQARRGRGRGHPRALLLSEIREAAAHARRAEAGVRRCLVRALAQELGRHPQGARLFHRHDLAQTSRRSARRCHSRPDGCAGRSRRQIFVRRNPRRP